jgi:hypothetical protein
MQAPVREGKLPIAWPNTGSEQCLECRMLTLHDQREQQRRETPILLFRSAACILSIDTRCRAGQLIRARLFLGGQHVLLVRQHILLIGLFLVLFLVQHSVLPWRLCKSWITKPHSTS